MDQKTEKALLEQQNELLELQLQELKEREDAYKMFNETILNAYNSMQSDVNKQNSLVYKQLQQTLEQYSQELIESKNRNTAVLSQLEKENRYLKNYLEQLELKIQEQAQVQENELTDLEQQYDALQQQQESTVIAKPKKKKSQQDKENNKPEQGGGGCIVSLKPKNDCGKKKELCISNVLNCKDSNVMEISQLDWLDSSSPTGLFKQFQILQRGRDRSDHSLRMQQQPQLSKRILRDQGKSEDSVSPQCIRNTTPQNHYITPESKQLKYDAQQGFASKAEQNQQKAEKRSLAEFTKQINSVRSTENFQMILRQSSLV
ncbi:unnamed protein product (macronuclear) [Paramecium tetraurelia]|uniref:Uncharacterized protein n=1 Tax=Paramecium tetraurelia TaxID=5888 RepID=A0DBM1_PARTE|nr:uncharacterized protein GSPATT00015334001 [Paramecium tetraurelia]CAK80438.1 unnamed protein product [Paramecium tetraurelia]|eukprot:XP_001447835.1 hypothetical protein (macronuclear) [Paramecium tetraurelia strain d4-2]